jgi:ATP-dependent helicase HepA
MAEKTWVAGQRWVSDSEPELGLGIILRGDRGKVEIMFPAAGEQRCYALASAPLRRVAFLPGDRILTHDGKEMVVDGVRESGGLRVYQTSLGEVAEAELSDSISFSKPEERLFGGKLDDPGDFDLRGEALERRAAIRRSPVRGLVGARMDLIAHQIFIADEVAGRARPRVLLADEVGLGKTIEACLIVHRLLLTGRAERILILVPEPLVHQWFIELLRRFQLSFDIFDEERCEAIEYGDEHANPFLDSQWVLAAVDLLAANPRRAAQALEAGWDVLVVDEAHHLEWSPREAAPAYQVVAGLAAQTEGVLLLTATPQQLGADGHFARLRLLDPERYADLERYREETRHYEEVAAVVDALAAGGDPGPNTEALVAGRPRLEALLARLRGGEGAARGELAARLLDGFGVGRVMFRNTRGRLGGFPERLPELVALDPAPGAKLRWLAGLLATLDAAEKVLVIVRTRELADEVIEGLRELSGVNAAPFHEALTLLQRDRNAAYFAEEEGARVLVCSEIGSEGRNFQFARHLVLLDLPEDVDLLEQRIGRLDRIGQGAKIFIHLPFLKGTAEAVRVAWLDAGLDALRRSPAGAGEIQQLLGAELGAAEAALDPALTAELIARSVEVRADVESRLARGQERLLERVSNRPERAAEVVAAIRAADEDLGSEEFLLRLLDFSGLHIEELGARRYFLLPGNLKSDAFPALPDEGLTVTLDRSRALAREQEAFFTWDHPLVRGALDLLLGSAAGNASFGVVEGAEGKSILLEARVLVEAVAPGRLHVERFLPQTPLHLLVDHLGAEHSPLSLAGKLRRGDPGSLLKNEKVRRQVIPALLERVRQAAQERLPAVVAAALTAMHAEFARETARLRELAEVNDHIRPEEIGAWQQREDALAAAIAGARLRLDSVRLVWKTPERSLT